MSHPASTFVLGYGVALLSVTLTLIVRLLLHPFLDTDAPLLLFTLSVMVSAWYGGYGPGVMATLLGAVTGANQRDARRRDTVVLALEGIVRRGLDSGRSRQSR